MIAYSKTITIQRFAQMKNCSKANVYSNLYKFILARNEDNDIIKPYRIILTTEALNWTPSKKYFTRAVNG